MTDIGIEKRRSTAAAAASPSRTTSCWSCCCSSPSPGWTPTRRPTPSWIGSLQAVFTASVDELAKVPHIGPNAALLISLIPTLYRRAMVSAANSEFVLDTRARMGEYFRELLSAEPKEVMYQLCLDAKGRRRNIYRVGEGDVASVSLNTRQIVENAINSKAAMVALAHNHPSGVPFPSPEDREATLRIRDALEMIDVRLVEHVIVADNDYISMWESGMMGP